METEAEITQKSHCRFNECFRNILAFILFSEFINVIGLMTSIIITVNSFRFKTDVQFSVASFLIIFCVLLSATAVYFIYTHVRRIQKIYEAQLISLVQLETSLNIRRAGSGGASQTIVFLDPTMLAETSTSGITPPPYSSVSGIPDRPNQN